jgi:hypothetical protein
MTYFLIASMYYFILICNDCKKCNSIYAIKYILFCARTNALKYNLK